MARKKDRVVIKIGSTSVERLGQRKIVNFISRIIKNYDVVLVSSGAGLRGEKIAQERGIKKLSKKLLCVLGQSEMYEDYRRLFFKRGLQSMQFLVNEDNNDSLLSWKTQLKEVLENKKIIPILNGDDLQQIKDLSFGDNEKVASEAQIAINAEYVITITDIDGVYNSNPNKNPQAKKFKILSYQFVEEILDKKNNLVDFYESKGAGGMYSKLYYAKKIMDYGNGKVYITNSLIDAEVFLDENYKTYKKCTGTYIYRNHNKGGFEMY